MGVRRATISERMLEFFKDGEPHCISEIQETFFDEYAERNAIYQQIHKTRRLLDKNTELLLCTIRNRTLHYQLVRPYVNSET